MSPRTSRRERGQSLVITAMIMLVVVLGVFFTFSVGERTRKKMRLQALADASAYSAAVAEARAMNFYAFSNRAIVSNMVAALSVAAHNSWVTWYEDALAGAVVDWLNISIRLRDNAVGGACGACSARLLKAADVAYDVAHWWAYAMPTYNNRIALHPRRAETPGSDSYRLESLPKFYTATRLYMNQAWVLRGGTPTLVDYVSANIWNRPADSGQPMTGNKSVFEKCVNVRSRWPGLGDDGNCLTNGGSPIPGVVGPRGAEWFHRQWHGKADGDPCSHLSSGRRDHLDHAMLLRQQQLNVDHELVHLLRGSASATPTRVTKNLTAIADLRDWLFNGTHLDPDPSEDDGDIPELGQGGTVDMYDSANQIPGSASTREPLALTLAKRTLPSVKLLQGSADLTLELYFKAVWPQHAAQSGALDPANPGRDMAHKDFDQMTYAARFPAWVYERQAEGSSDDLLRDQNWQQLVNGARTLVTNRFGGGAALDTRAFYTGNAKYLWERELPVSITSSSQGQIYAPAGALKDNIKPWWEYSNNPGYTHPTTGDYIPNWYSWRPPASLALRDVVNETSIPEVFGRMSGQGVYDRGHVWAEFAVGTACGASCDTLREDVVQGAGRDGNWNRGDGTAPRGIHFFHGEAPHLGHRYGAINQSTDHSYIGHMRFRATAQPDELWGMPRTVVMLAEPVKDPSVTFAGKPGARPWDFKLNATKWFGDWSYQTVDGIGDQAANDEMAAVAGGLAYYHSPQAWDEPPNLWNPFWRAKLHPLKSDHVQQSGHAATAAAVGALGQRYVNE